MFINDKIQINRKISKTFKISQKIGLFAKLYQRSIVLFKDDIIVKEEKISERNCMEWRNQQCNNCDSCRR